MSSDQRDGSTIKLFFQLNNHTLLHRWLYRKRRWTHKVFEGIRRWSVIKLVTIIHGHSNLTSLEIVVGDWKVRNPGKWVTRETRYRVSIAKLLIRNLMNQVAELFRRPTTMLEILYFSGDHQLFQKSPGIKILYDQGREPFHLLAGEAEFETGEGFSVKLSIAEATGAYLTGALGQCVCMLHKVILMIKFTFVFNLKTCKFRTKRSEKL